MNWSVDIKKTIFAGTEPYPSDFHGGWYTDEIAALISLKLGVRAHAIITTREYNYNTPEHGQPRAEQNPPPVFSSNNRALTIPFWRKNTSIAELKEINNIHLLDEQKLNFLIKAAISIQESLWICVSSLNIAWLLMVSALETAAQQWDKSKGNNIKKFQESKPDLFKMLDNDQYKHLIPIISDEFPSTFRAGKNSEIFVSNSYLMNHRNALSLGL